MRLCSACCYWQSLKQEFRLNCIVWTKVEPQTVILLQFSYEKMVSLVILSITLVKLETFS